MALDNVLLSGEHWTTSDDKHFRDQYWERCLKSSERIGEYWHDSESHATHLTTLVGDILTAKQRWDKFWSEFRDIRDDALSKNEAFRGLPIEADFKLTYHKTISCVRSQTKLMLNGPRLLNIQYS